MKISTTIILHSNINSENFTNTILSIVNQSNRYFDIVFIGEIDAETSKLLRKNNIEFHWIVKSDKSFAELMNEATKQTDSDFFLYIDNMENPVILKEAAIDAFQMASERNPSAGFIYADYDLISGNQTKEIHLLNHHIGRVRDNQDYGKVFYIKNEAIFVAGGFDEKIKYNNLYDMRLKISESFNMIRVSNKYSGSFYSVVAEGKKSNVFDYLLSSKDVQLEAEDVVTNHLKRVNAYLPPSVYNNSNNKFEHTPELKASVIIPVGHRPKFIGTAIESIQAQTIKDIEAIIVVNGGNDDPTADAVRKYMKGGELYDADKPKIRLIVIDINSIGLCLNIGAKNARGKYYVQLDSDDRLKPDAVEKIIKVFDANDNTGMVIGSYEVWEKHDDGKMSRMEEIPVVTHDEWTDDNGRNNLLRINGAGAPRSIPINIIKEMGYFSINDDEFARNYGEDYEMVMKISEYYKIGRVYDPIYEVVRHSGGTDHAINDDLVMRNDEAKDDMRKHTILRRIAFNNNYKRLINEKENEAEIIDENINLEKMKKAKKKDEKKSKKAKEEKKKLKKKAEKKELKKKAKKKEEKKGKKAKKKDKSKKKK